MDAAYPLGERTLTPFTGADRLDTYKDAFNFYLSQLRIRVEMVFGRLVNKFRILHGCVEGSIIRSSQVLTACARLHNCVILKNSDGAVRRGETEAPSLTHDDESTNGEYLVMH